MRNERLNIKLKTIRLEQSEDGAVGVLLYLDRIFCMTLEPDEGDPDRFQIPPGVYPLKHFKGSKWTKWHNTLEIVVPDHTVLLFHAGNIEAHTEGCTVLGSEAWKLYGKRAVKNSGTTFKRFQREVVPNIVDGDMIEIVDFFPGAFLGA
ncbi:hypothetical protein KAR91_43045 [Candidatus Pacearchaeota archaeon]|nr:hypothetical protein [Candidatus Pacearchaeota archaeon]